MTSPLDTALKGRNQRPHRDLINPPRLLNLSPDQDERAIVRGTFIEKSTVLGTARGPVQAAREFRAKYNELRSATKEPRELAKRASAAAEEITRKFDSLLPQLAKQRDSLEKEIAKVLQPAVADEAAQEIRGHFKNAKAPFDEAAKLLAAGEIRTVRALLAAPYYLCGLTEAQQNTLRDQARTKWCPDQSGLSADIARAIEKVQAVGGAFAAEVGEVLHEELGAPEQAFGP
jgi:hypothetical protein